MAFCSLLRRGLTAYQALDSVQWHLEHLLRELHSTQWSLLLLNSKSYRFRADQYGTSWYHSHYSSKYAGGILGPMIIHGPSNYDYDIDLGPVFVQDCGYSYILKPEYLTFSRVP